MSVASIQSTIERVQREIESLHRQATDEDRKHASKTERIAQISQSITKHTSLSTLQSKQREIEGLERDIVCIQKRRADITKRIGDKTAEMHRHQQSLFKEQQRDQKTLSEALQRRDREWRTRQDAMLRELLAQSSGSGGPVSVDRSTDSRTFDAFIAHATEDKETLVRPLAEKLVAMGFAVWYDEFQLKVGDSLRRSIDRGLASSRFGIVVLSPAFFARNWPQYELDGLVAKEMQGGEVILPLWHKVSKDEVIAYSPPLADKLALNTSMYTIDELAFELTRAMRD